MTGAELQAIEAPDDLPPLLAALWHDDRGNWERAHEIAQAIPSASGSRVHAYLHRREGDLGNASYWYARAGVSVPTTYSKRSGRIWSRN